MRIKESNEIVNVCDKRIAHSTLHYEKIFITNDGQKFLHLNGKTSANGYEYWFYNLRNFKIKSNIIIPEFLPNPDYKLKL